MQQQMNQSAPSGQMNEMMGKKVGGKMTLGEYFKFQWKYYMWLLIGSVVISGVSLIPALYWIRILNSLVWLYGAFVMFWFGYQLVKMKHGELKDALIGGGVLGLAIGLIMGILGAIGTFIYFNTATFGILGGFGAAGAIGIFFGQAISGAIGGLVASLIGYAVAGGFNKPTTPPAQR